jgi:Na+/H+ antiporter NhaC
VIQSGKPRILPAATVIVALAICAVAYWAGRRLPPETPPWYSVVPPVLAVSLALVTNRLFLSLIAAVLAGGLLSVLGEWPGVPSTLVQGAVRGAEFVVGTLYDVDHPGPLLDRFDASNLLILLFVVLIMPTISVMLVGGGLQGVANWLVRFARSVRSTKLVTMASGLAIFIDDYANTMIVGPTLRPVTDRQRISREKLAFLVDATAAPVAGIALVSTWIGYEVGLLGDIAQSLAIDRGGYELFFDALGFRFYCFGMIAFVFFNSYSGEDFGPMAAAEGRAAKHGKLLDDDARVMTSRSTASAAPHPNARIHAAVAIVPMALLLVVFLALFWLDEAGRGLLASDPGAILSPSGWREVFGAVDSIPLLAYASAAALLVAAVLARGLGRIPVWALGKALVVGLRGAALPVTVLILAWSLKGTCDELGTGRFLAGVLGRAISPLVFPGLVFVVAALTSFATGTSFGTMAILIPTAIPVAFQLDGSSYGLVTMISIGAILDGAIFGDHCSPISDTTIMSSTASSCDHLAHVRTQMPYSLVVATFALGAGYLPASAGLSKWLGHLTGAALSGLLFVALRASRLREEQAGAVPAGAGAEAGRRGALAGRVLGAALLAVGGSAVSGSAIWHSSGAVSGKPVLPLLIWGALTFVGYLVFMGASRRHDRPLGRRMVAVLVGAIAVVGLAAFGTMAACGEILKNGTVPPIVSGVLLVLAFVMFRSD